MHDVSSFLASILVASMLLFAAPVVRARVVFQSAELTARTFGYIGEDHWDNEDSLFSAPPERLIRMLVEGDLRNSEGFGLTQAFMGLETSRDWTNFYLVEVTQIDPVAPNPTAGGTTICEWTVRFTLDERQRFDFGVETLLEFGRSPPNGADPADLWEFVETFALLDAEDQPVFVVHRESAEREVHRRSGILGAGEYMLQVRSEFGFTIQPPLTPAGVDSNFGGEIRFSPVPEPASISLASLVCALAFGLRICLVAAPHGRPLSPS